MILVDERIQPCLRPSKTVAMMPRLYKPHTHTHNEVLVGCYNLPARCCSYLTIKKLPGFKILRLSTAAAIQIICTRLLASQTLYYCSQSISLMNQAIMFPRAIVQGPAGAQYFLRSVGIQLKEEDHYYCSRTKATVQSLFGWIIHSFCQYEYLDSLLFFSVLFLQLRFFKHGWQQKQF